MEDWEEELRTTAALPCCMVTDTCCIRHVLWCKSLDEFANIIEDLECLGTKGSRNFKGQRNVVIKDEYLGQVN